MLIHHFLEKSAAQFPDKVALIHEQTRATYGQINADADSLASFLVGRGVQKGDRVVILLENGYEYVVAYYGILKAGAVVVPLSTGTKPAGLNPSWQSSNQQPWFRRPVSKGCSWRPI